jgi:hypothetical protein
MRRRALAVGIVGCLVAAAIVGSASAATAATVGPYNVDGTVPDVGATSYVDTNGNKKELGPLNSNTTKIGVIHKDAPPTLGETNPNAQVDLNLAWLATARTGGEDFLYFAWQRDSNSGSGFIAYEFMKNAAPTACAYTTATTADLIANCNPWANRQAGDFMILWDQQGGSTKLYVRIWSGTAPNLTLSPLSELPANTYDSRYSGDGFRGEAAINLTANGMGSDGACLAFANVIPSTVTGNSDTADYKDTILQPISLSNCGSTTVTTPTDGSGMSIPSGVSIGTGVVAVQDSALVSVTGGNAAAAGSVGFWLCKVDTGTCDGTAGREGTSVGSTNLGAGTYPQTVSSPTAYVTSVGRYCWRAVFTGDPANSIPGSSDSSTGECFMVTAVTPTLTTSAGDDVFLGEAVSDSATLTGTATQPANPVINLTGTGGAVADGTITFTLYGPSTDGCGALVSTSAAVPVTGNGSYNTPDPQFVPGNAGDYHWVAVYSGSLPNTNGVTHNAACNDDDEDVTVKTVPSTLSSAQSWVPNDSVTVSAAASSGDLAGTVSFDLYASSDCSGTPIYHTTTAVTGASPQTVSSSNTTAVTASGEYSWKVSYDSTNSAQRDIAASCHETSSLTIANGGSVGS